MKKERLFQVIESPQLEIILDMNSEKEVQEKVIFEFFQEEDPKTKIDEVSFILPADYFSKPQYVIVDTLNSNFYTIRTTLSKSEYTIVPANTFMKEYNTVKKHDLIILESKGFKIFFKEFGKLVNPQKLNFFFSDDYKNEFHYIDDSSFPNAINILVISNKGSQYLNLNERKIINDFFEETLKQYEHLKSTSSFIFLETNYYLEAHLQQELKDTRQIIYINPPSLDSFLETNTANTIFMNRGDYENLQNSLEHRIIVSNETSLTGIYQSEKRLLDNLLGKAKKIKINYRLEMFKFEKQKINFKIFSNSKWVAVNRFDLIDNYVGFSFINSKEEIFVKYSNYKKGDFINGIAPHKYLPDDLSELYHGEKKNFIIKVISNTDKAMMEGYLMEGTNILEVENTW